MTRAAPIGGVEVNVTSSVDAYSVLYSNGSVGSPN